MTTQQKYVSYIHSCFFLSPQYIFSFKNRPAHKSPGERSSQYAAESSCRERYGDLTEWLTFIDTDEYMVSD